MARQTVSAVMTFSVPAIGHKIVVNLNQHDGLDIAAAANCLL